jgi:hypothetical protein
VLSAWGNAGQYTLMSQLAGPDGRLAANSLCTAQASLALIAGPALAGLLVAPLGTGSILGLDAASFAFLGIQAWRTRPSSAAAKLRSRSMSGRRNRVSGCCVGSAWSASSR